jgi:hypothetical protein
VRRLGLRVAVPWRGVPVALLAGALLVLPSPALGTGPTNPLSPGLPQSPGAVPTTATPTVTATQTTSTAGSSGLSGTGTLVIAVGALVILTGISFFIWRDARRRAPVRARGGAMAADDGTGGRAGSKARAKPRKLSPAERRRRKRGRARR